MKSMLFKAWPYLLRLAMTATYSTILDGWSDVYTPSRLTAIVWLVGFVALIIAMVWQLVIDIREDNRD